MTAACQCALEENEATAVTIVLALIKVEVLFTADEGERVHIGNVEIHGCKD